jgi:nucleotide-binding universal stress UspA family protein
MSAQTTSGRLTADIGTRERIVVGVDDIVRGSGPLLWACQEADRHHAALQVVSARPVGAGPPPTRPATDLGADPAESRQRSLADLARKLCTDAAVLPPQVETGTPAQVLVRSLDQYTLMVVVGRRTRAGVQHLLLGSTSVAVAGAAPVPVVVIPDSWTPGRTASSPVVVGVAGDDDEPVLRFAFERAAALRVPVVAVHAWEIPALLSWSPDEIAEMRDRVAAALDRRLDPWRAEFPGLEVVTAAPAERPVDAVLDAGRVAQLMVVGRHTRGARHLGPRLGSTTRSVLQHAKLPVAVVPLQRSEGNADPRTHVASDVWAPMY